MQYHEFAQGKFVVAKASINFVPQCIARFEIARFRRCNQSSKRTKPALGTTDQSSHTRHLNFASWRFAPEALPGLCLVAFAIPGHKGTFPAPVCPFSAHMRLRAARARIN